MFTIKMYYFSVCVSTHIAKILNAFEIKLTIKSNLFKNDCLFIHRILQQKYRLKYIGRLPQFTNTTTTAKTLFYFVFLSHLNIF